MPQTESLPLHYQSPDLERLLGALLEISNFVGSVMLLDDILARIVRITAEMLNVPVCSIFLLNEEQRLVLRSNVGFEPELIGQASFELGNGITGWVAQTGQLVATPDANQDHRYLPLPSTLELGCRAFLCAPLRIQDAIVGVMTARKAEWYEFSYNEILFFETVCKQIAIVLEKSRMYEEKLQADRLATVAISLSGVAHYIKNVLMTMQGGEYLVDQGFRDGSLEQARQGWSVLQRATRKIRSLVENILNYCRQTELKTRPFNLNDMINDMLQSLDENAHERNVQLHAQLDASLGEVEADPDALYDAILNLVTNAIDAVANDRSGNVWVHTQRLDGGRNQYLIEVVDDGVGISEENRQKIFTLFFSTKGQKGTGIGLAATRQIIENHGGTIELVPDSGHGAHFKIYMPLHTAE
jgi:signal transduction histidine kinase